MKLFNSEWTNLKLLDKSGYVLGLLKGIEQNTDP